MFELRNLDESTRQLMLEEIDRDIQNGLLHVSPRLSNTGQQNYVALFREAVRAHNADWLGDQLGTLGRMKSSEHRRKPRGGYTIARIPNVAADTFAEGEFNRFYMRALCRRAIADGIPYLIVYRAKEVRQPRPESEWLLGSEIDPQQLLSDLRAHPGTATEHGVPGGPGSGLSVRLP